MGLGPLRIDCDAPPYHICAACAGFGVDLRRPLDVRWCRGAGRDFCQCGALLPMPDRFEFLLSSGKREHYALCQCRLCDAVYWEEL